MAIAVSLFGTTDPGLEIRTTSGLEVSPDAAWISISTSEVSLLTRDFVVCVSRRIVGGNILTWIGMYRRAYSIGADRSGNFYGSGIWLLGMAASGKLVLELLPQLCDEINRLAMKGERFVRKLVDVRGEISWTEVKPIADRLSNSLRPCSASSGLIAGNLPTLYLDASSADQGTISLGWILDWAQDGSAFASYSRVVLSTYPEAFSPLRSTGSSRILTPEGLRQTEEAARKELLGQIQSLESDLLRERAVLQRANTEFQVLEQKLRTVHAPYRAIIPLVGEATEQLRSASASLAQIEDALARAEGSQAPTAESIPVAGVGVAMPLQTHPVSEPLVRVPFEVPEAYGRSYHISHEYGHSQSADPFRESAKRSGRASGKVPDDKWYRGSKWVVLIGGMVFAVILAVVIASWLLYNLDP